MRDIAPELLTWIDDGRAFAVAVVVDTWSSAPRPVGAMLLLDDAGHVVGGLSGGCVEADVIARGEQALVTGRAERAHYGVSDSDALQVGLPCGGHIDVLVVPVDAERRATLRVAATRALADDPVALTLVTADPLAPNTGAPDTGAPDADPGRVGRLMALVPNDPAPTGSLGGARLDHSVGDDAAGLLAAGRTGYLRYGPDAERLGAGLDVLVISHAPRPRMLIFGAIDHARALTRAARLLGHHVTVCDARAMFATRARFPEADEIVVARPHTYLTEQIAAGQIDARTVLIDLTHDLKFDIPLLRTALDPRCPAGFVGAMGSRRTNDRRRDQLRAEGMPDAWWDRLHAPVGLDLGARTPEATAISILAEVIATEWHGTGAPLRGVDAPIHHD